MANDKYGQGGRYAPHRYTGNRAYEPIVIKTGPSLGCISTALAVLTIIIWYAVTYGF